jgi:transposase
LYEKHILKPLLYPYCEKLQDMYPERRVWLIKDNASIHTKAEWTAAQFRVTARIRKAPWPPNSPDLHPIENLWDYEKDIIKDKPVHGASESEKKQIKELATKEWLAMDSKVKQCIGTFKDRLERCIKANGDNNFRG